jgi:hypothetical protein
VTRARTVSPASSPHPRLAAVALDPASSARPTLRSAALARAAVVPLRSAARARLGPSVCATRSRRVSAALRVRARMVHGALARLAVPLMRLSTPLDAPVYPPPPHEYSMRSDRII